MAHSKLLLLILMFGLIATPSFSATYYFDSVAGSDDNTGLSEEQAWQTFEKFNATTWFPGDNIKFKGGQTFNVGGWSNHLLIDDSGTEASPITITSYGTGQAILDGMNPDAYTTFVEGDPNIWSKYHGQVSNRWWLDGVEQYGSKDLAHLSSTLSWYVSGTTIYVYSETDPNGHWTSYGAQNGLKLLNANYINIENITISGARYYCITMRNSSHNKLTNLNIYNFGDSAIHLGPQASSSTENQSYNEITYSNINSQYTKEYVSNQYTGYSGTISGVKMQGRCSYNNISHLKINNFFHGGIEMSAYGGALGSVYNVIEDNTLDCGSLFYSRGLGIGGQDQACMYNHIRRNLIKNCTIRSQINGESNYWYNNIWIDGGKSPLYSDHSQHVQFQEWPDSDCDNNLFENNVLIGAYDVGFFSYDSEIHGNIFRNNILLNNGYGRSSDAQLEIGSDMPADGASFYNNIFYSDSTEDVIKYRGTAYTVSEADTAYDELHDNIQADPTLIASGLNIYCPDTGSPAINAGTATNKKFDFYYNIVGADDLVDIGACEIGNSVKYIRIKDAK